MLSDKGFRFKRNCVLRRWESQRLNRGYLPAGRSVLVLAIKKVFIVTIFIVY